MSINVLSEITVYEQDGKENPPGEPFPTILARSHWNIREMVVLEVAGRRYTVQAKDLITAAENACRTNKI